MSQAADTYAMLFKLASSSHEVQLVKEAVAPVAPAAKLLALLKNPKVAWGLAGTGLGAAGLGIPLAYSAGESAAEDEATTTRNLAFGAGLLSGLVGPSLLKGVGGMLGNLGLTSGDVPSGAY